MNKTLDKTMTHYIANFFENGSSFGILDKKTFEMCILLCKFSIPGKNDVPSYFPPKDMAPNLSWSFFILFGGPTMSDVPVSAIA